MSVEKEHSEPRYRAKLRTQPGAPAIFITGSKCGSIQLAKREAEIIFGPLIWNKPGLDFDFDVKLIAHVEL